MFLYLTARIILRGLAWGNLVGIGFALIQRYTRILPLDEESYYISYVPVSLNITDILLINATTFILCLIMVLVPGYIIGTITPVKAIQYR